MNPCAGKNVHTMYTLTDLINNRLTYTGYEKSNLLQRTSILRNYMSNQTSRCVDLRNNNSDATNYIS